MSLNTLDRAICIDKIELTETEETLLKALKTFTINPSEEYKKRLLKLENCFLLTKSLIARDAVPHHRIDYFVKAEYRLSDTRKSRLQVFESNNTSGEAIFRHPHFLKYLKYFIYGADLPQAIITQIKAIKAETFYDSDFVEQALPNIKSYFNANYDKASRNAFSEEIFKLSLDLGVEFSDSVQLRNKVMKFK